MIAHKTLKTEQQNECGGPEIFPALVVIGLGFSIVLQAMFHMAVNVGAMPVTGQTLPLVSMGGTSLWFVLAALGIILNIAYDYSPEGLAEESVKKQYRAKVGDFKKFDGRGNVQNYTTEEAAVHRPSRQKEKNEDEFLEENFEEIGENGLPDLEKQLQDEGREVLQELNRRGRRSRA